MSKYFDYLEAHGGLDPEGQEPDEAPEPTQGLCYFCRQVDDAHKLITVSGHWLAHPKCSEKATSERQWSQR